MFSAIAIAARNPQVHHPPLRVERAAEAAEM
jgi:hypothetical protein